MRKIYFIVLLMAGIGTFSSCTKDRIRGEGPVVEQNISVDSFSGIDLANAMDVVVTLGGSQSIRAEGQQNIIDRLKTTITPDGVLILDLENGIYGNFKLTIYVTVPIADKFFISGSGNMSITPSSDAATNQLDQLQMEISGSGNLIVFDQLKVLNHTDLEISGSGNIELDVQTNTTDVLISGSGNMGLQGSTSEQNIRINGSGNYNAFDFESDTTTVTIPGSGNVKCRVNSLLDVNISGSGDVRYKGQPTINSNISGSGNIVNAN